MKRLNKMLKKVKGRIGARVQAMERSFVKRHYKGIQKAATLLNQCKLEAAAFVIGGCSVSNAYATATANSMIKSIIDQVVTLFPAIGVVIALVGAFKLFMAFRNDQPDSYSNAIKDIVIGALLIGFKYLIWSGGANLKAQIK